MDFNHNGPISIGSSIVTNLAQERKMFTDVNNNNNILIKSYAEERAYGILCNAKLYREP